MTKREIIKWLEKKYEEAVNVNTQKYNQLTSDYMLKRKADCGFDNAVDSVTRSLDSIVAFIEKWYNDVSNKGEYGVTQNYYGNVLAEANQLRSKVQYGFDRLFDNNDKKICAIQEERRKAQGLIDKNHTAVIENVRSMASPKEAIEYLKTLGFNTSELNAPTKNLCTAIATPVDTQWLFVKEERQIQEEPYDAAR